MKWLRKWAYPLLFLCSGLVYFVCVDHGQVYEGVLQNLTGRHEGAGEEGEGGQKAVAVAALDGTRILGKTIESGSGQGAFWPESPEGKDHMTGPGEESGQGDSEQSNPEEGSSQEGAGQGSTEEGDVSESYGQSGSEGAGEDAGQESGEPKPVEYMTVEDDYFADAVFIGDSRTVGMFEYGGLGGGSTFYASKGLTIYKLFDSAVAPSPEGKITVEEALQLNQFAKIYLMIGINEMGTGTLEGFLEKYGEVVARLQELQPDAIIYLQGIMKVTSKRSAQGDYINNEGIDARNEGIAALADDETIFYLDVNPLICDETGGMDPQYTYDGVHPKGKDIQIWKDYLKTHAISP